MFESRFTMLKFLWTLQIKFFFLLKKKTNKQKQRQYFANKGPSSQGYGFSSGHVWMWELDYEEG